MSTVKSQLTALPFVLKSRIGPNWVLYINASTLIAATAITSGLGFIYWWLAARLFPPAVVGFASAAVSAMMLLGAVGMLGLGTLIITEIGHQPHEVGSIAMTAILLVSIASIILGVLFALAAPSLTADLSPLSSSTGNIIIFAVGVAFTAVTSLVDLIMIALLRGGLQLWRNIWFALTKLIILYGVSVWTAENAGMNIYLAWTIGNIASLVIIAGYLIYKRTRILYPPHFGFIRHLGGHALAHHATNLILQAPSLIMPIAVTTLISARVNAGFYAAWMIASFLFVLPSHLTTVLHAVGAQSPSAVIIRMRATMRTAYRVGIPACIILFIGAGPLLSFFGKEYVDEAAWCLRILSLGVFALTIKYHYVALLRVYSQVQSAITLFFFGSLLEVVLGVIGLKIAALTGLSLGWLIAVSIEAIIMYIRLQHMIRSEQMVSQQAVSVPQAST